MPGVTRSRTCRREAVLRVERVEAVELVERVDDDATDPAAAGHPQLVEALVVAVQHEAVGGEAGRERDVQLSPGGDVEPQPLLVDQAGHGKAEKRFGRVDREPVAERRRGLTAAGPQVLLVVDEEWRAVLGREVEQVDSADREAPAGVDRRRVGQEMPRERAHIESGACTPSTSRPIASPVRTASTNHNRACVSSALTPSPIT